MLIFGHRGAAGQKAENTLASIQAGLKSGASIIEVDVRLTKDNKPVLMHDADLKRTHGIKTKVSELTLKELQKRTAGTDKPICTVADALKAAYGKVILNLELKVKGSGKAVLEICRDQGITSREAWELILISSFSARELRRVRNLNPRVQLALLHHVNPYAFVVWDRSLKLSAVGFHRLHIPRLVLQIAKQQKIFSYVYTVNRPEAAKRLIRLGVDGIVTDYPEKFVKLFT